MVRTCFHFFTIVTVVHCLPIQMNNDGHYKHSTTLEVISQSRAHRQFISSSVVYVKLDRWPPISVGALFYLVKWNFLFTRARTNAQVNTNNHMSCAVQPVCPDIYCNDRETRKVASYTIGNCFLSRYISDVRESFSLRTRSEK